MAQWVNRLRNNIFVNPQPLPLSCEIFGALHLAQLGLTAGWLAGRLADEIQADFEIFKIDCRLKYFPEAIQFLTNPYYQVLTYFIYIIKYGST